MASRSRGRALRHMAVLLCCATLAGCGVFSVNREAKRYREEQATQVKDELEACRKGTVAAAHKMDHRTAPGAGPDCYLAVVTGSSRMLVEPPQPLPAPPPEGSKQAVAVLSSVELAQATSASAVVGQVAWPAMLSKMVYRRFVATDKRSKDKDACTYLLEMHPLKRWNQAASATSGYRWDTWKPKGIGCQAIGGLFYETYVYQPFSGGVALDGGITQAVMVFRGTENYRGQARDDWATNAAMAFDITPSQFEQVRLDLRGLIDELKREGAPELRIYTAGHSLGGSLAQLAAYLNEDVQAAYAYNTSPVTGWTWLRGLHATDPGLMPVQDPKIIRIWQDAEILGMLRTFSNAANSTVRRTGRTDVSFDFPASRAVIKDTGSTGQVGGGSALHSITLLACNLAARVAKGAPTAFGFTKEMAQTALLERNGDYTEKGAKETEGLCQVLGNKDATGKPSSCEVDWITGSANCNAFDDPAVRGVQASK